MNRKKLVKMTLSLVLGLVMVSCGESSPADIEMSIMQQLQKENYEKAIDIWVENTQWEEDADIGEMKEQMRVLAGKMKQSVQEQGGIKEVILIEEDIEDNYAGVIYLVKYGDGTEEKNEIEYEKVNGKWKRENRK